VRDDSKTRSTDHLRLVTDTVEAGAVDPGALDSRTPRPRTIGRLIAQTAMIAEGAVSKRRDARPQGTPRSGLSERLLRHLR
jgi:hypothetical protein